ncbi:hypothetical protein OAK55_01375 [Akkermansiaceae bacterium]|nr:hypothetical protein [Akkermansiaceae bacterium]
MESVTFSEPTEQENISLEQQAAMQDEQATEQQPETAEASPDRPEWLPEKFDNPEALADAYSNLEKQFHENKAEPSETDDNNNTSTQETPEVTNSAVTSASEEFFETGELSEETYKSLEANGIPKEMVDMYVNGYEAVANQQQQTLMQEAGGKENYEAMSEWAATSLTDQEQEVYNNTVESGDVNAATMAIRGLYARFQSDGGTPVSLVQGDTSGTSGAMPFSSSKEMTIAMQDPRYGYDNKYREQVSQRLSVTTAF